MGRETVLVPVTWAEGTRKLYYCVSQLTSVMAKASFQYSITAILGTHTSI